MAERFRVFYNSFAPPEIYEVMRASCPAELQLILLDADDDRQRFEKIAMVRGVIVAATPLTRALIEAAPGLELVQHQGVGYQDTVDVMPLRERGIRLALTTEGISSVAEHTVLLMLAACRRLAFADAELRQGRWHGNSLRHVSVGIAGKTIGYVGMGRVGRAVAKRLRAFDTSGLYFDPGVTLNAGEAGELGVAKVELQQLLEAADIITLHLPLTGSTRGLIGRNELAQMKPRAVLVNAARGEVVDEAALIEGLRRGHPLAAGLDVFAEEPLPATSASLPNVVLTPHIGAGSWDALVDKMRFALGNIRNFAMGRGLENEVRLD